MTMLMRRRQSHGGVAAFFKYTAGDSLAGWTTSRASAGSYYDATGTVQSAGVNVMRDGHYLGGVRHWLLEPARTNVILWSEDFSNVAWSAARCTASANATTAPDGNATADGLVGNNAANVSCYFFQQPAGTASTNQAASVFAKPGNKNWAHVQFTDRASVVHNNWFNVSTGAAGTIDGSCTAKMWPVANGFYHIEVRLSSAGVGAPNPFIAFGFADADASLVCTGDGATINGYLWGGQWESDQAWPSSYIATTSASVTRSGDASPTIPHNSTPQPRTLYIKVTNIWGGPNNNAPLGGFNLGNLASNGQEIRSGGSAFQATLVNNVTSCAASSNPATPVGSVLEGRSSSALDLTVTVGQSVNGVAETTATSAVNANGYQGAYGSAVYQLVSSGNTLVAIQQVKDILGVQSMATCRSA